MNKKAGYTLIEFLVVLGILAVAIGSSLVFLTTVLRGSGEANISAEVKQNGQAVLDSLDSTVRNATDVATNNNKHLKLSMVSGLPLHVRCFSDSTPKSENGWIGTVESSSDDPAASSYSSLTNRNEVSGVDVNGCDFQVLNATQGASGPPIVRISFSAMQGIGSPSAQSTPVNISFDTTISLRQY